MTSTSNITGLNGSVAPAPVPAVTAATSATQSAPSSVSTSSLPALSPRITFDPSAGEIIQYLNSGGQIQDQIPSSTVVAYLRAGLTAQGFTKPQNTTA